MKNNKEFLLHVICILSFVFIEYFLNVTNSKRWTLFYILYLMCLIDVSLTYIVYRKAKDNHVVETNPIIVVFMKVFKTNWVYPSFLMSILMFFLLSDLIETSKSTYFLMMFLGYYIGVLKYNYIILKGGG